MYIIRSLPIFFLYVVHFIFPSEVQLGILSIIYSIHILTFQKKWNSLTLSTSGWTWSLHAEGVHREISSLPKPRWGVQPSPAVSNVRLLLTDEDEASRLREPGTVSATALAPSGEETGRRLAVYVVLRKRTDAAGSISVYWTTGTARSRYSWKKK